MLTKSNTDEIQSYLSDASYMQAGSAERVVFPQSTEEVAEVLALATQQNTPVTVSGAGTGTVGGRVPFGGIVLATDNLNRIKSLGHDKGGGGRAVVEAGVLLCNLQRFVEAQGLFYPPDPTERGCFIGGNVATNASGARTFKYGPTRNYIERLKVCLATGEILDLRRGQFRADCANQIKIPLSARHTLEAQLPSYHMPHVRKNASGYFVAPGMDVVDLFIGSEGTLGVISEVEVALIPKPESILSGVVFFSANDKLLEFVSEARTHSLANRERQEPGRLGPLMDKALEVTDRRKLSPPDAGSGHRRRLIDARALEYFDRESLAFLRQKYDSIPAAATGAVFFEEEITASSEDAVMSEWLSLLEKHEALIDESWFAANEPDQVKLREFRHALPVLMNEWFARYNQRKISTDMSVPDEEFAGMLAFYEELLAASKLRYTIFGHIGDNHVHVNILPRDDVEAAQGRELYWKFVRHAVKVGGTISAEHGIGKLKREYLRELYGEKHLREMAALKKAFDPAGILGRGNIISETYLD
ncbi:MAG TPA: FAD-binding oxidoreductase [Pyrinomonadaceae bacterium]|nr:FAD-binding oxidoreductase [Pyrinomonadaceae bacterium]